MAGLIGSSARMQELRMILQQVARSNVSVLITGPSGCGKEVVARSLHAASARANGAFVAVNCGAIPRELLESELFGHEKGAFTGAIQSRKGRFETADQGSIFLDEIGDMPADMQVKLLRVLEERQFERVGGNRTISVDTRVISATHRDLELAISEERFREDLFYRLSIFPIEVPSLAERAEDVGELAEHFARSIGGGEPVVRFGAQAQALMAEHGWPGNVRELRNFVERASILFPGQTVDADGVAMMLRRKPRAQAARTPEQKALWDAAASVGEAVQSAAAPQAPVEAAPICVLPASVAAAPAVSSEPVVEASAAPAVVASTTQTSSADVFSAADLARALAEAAPHAFATAPGGPAADCGASGEPAPFGIDPRRVLASGGLDLKSVVAELERSFIRAALDDSNDVVADAARLLCLQRTTLIEKMRKYEIRRAA